MLFAWSIAALFCAISATAADIISALAAAIWSRVGALQWGVQSESSAACWSKPLRLSSSESKRPVRRMVVGITGCLVPLCSRARIRTMETLGRAGGSLTFGLNTKRVERLACCVRNLESCWGAKDHLRASFQELLQRRQGAPAAQRVTMSSSAVKTFSVMRSPRGVLVLEPGCAMRQVPWQANARCASANNPYVHRFGIGSYSRRIGG